MSITTSNQSLHIKFDLKLFEFIPMNYFFSPPKEKNKFVLDSQQKNACENCFCSVLK